MEKKTKIIIALATILAILVIIYLEMPYNIKIVHIINKTYVSQVNNYSFVYNSTPIKITQNSLFGNASNIKGIICKNKTFIFYLKNISNVSVLYDGNYYVPPNTTSQMPLNSILSNGTYAPTYILLEGNYYKSNLTSKGLSYIGNDYMPSLIGENVSIVVFSHSLYVSSVNAILSIYDFVPYRIKSETIKGNAVIWNLTFDGNISNATKLFYNKTFGPSDVIFNGKLQNDPGIILQNNYIATIEGRCSQK